MKDLLEWAGPEVSRDGVYRTVKTCETTEHPGT